MPKVGDVNIQMSNLFSELDRVFSNTVGMTDERVLFAYKNTLKEVGNQLKDVYAKFGDKPTITQLRRYNRLAVIEKNIAQKINDLNIATGNIIHNGIRTVAKEGVIKTEDVIKVASGLTLDFKPDLATNAVNKIMEDNHWLDVLKNNHAKLLSDVKYKMEQVLRANSKETIVSGLATGQSYNRVMKDIQERFGTTAARAKTITFTEMHKGHSAGRDAAMQSAQDAAKKLGIDAGKTWQENYVGESRPDHIAATGKFADENGIFFVGGEHLSAPGLGSKPENNINCHCTVEFRLKEKQANQKQIDRLVEKKVVKKSKLDLAEERGKKFAANFYNKNKAQFDRLTKFRHIFENYDLNDAINWEKPVVIEGKKYLVADIANEMRVLNQKFARGLMDDMAKWNKNVAKELEFDIKQWYQSSVSSGAGQLKYLAGKLNGSKVYYQRIPNTTEKFLDTVKRLQNMLEEWQAGAMRVAHFSMEDGVAGLHQIQAANQWIVSKFYGKSTLTLYRGVRRDYLRTMNMTVKQVANKTVEITENALASWSVSEAVAWNFAGGDGVVFKAQVGMDEVFSSFLSTKGFVEELEFIVMPKNNIIKARGYLKWID